MPASRRALLMGRCMRALVYMFLFFAAFMASAAFLSTFVPYPARVPFFIFYLILCVFVGSLIEERKNPKKVDGLFIVLLMGSFLFFILSL